MAMSERKICMGNLQYCWVIEDEFMYKELSITISYIIPPFIVAWRAITETLYMYMAQAHETGTSGQK